MTWLAIHAFKNERFRDIVMSPTSSPRRSRLEFSQPVRFHARHPCLAECTSRDTTGSLICLDLLGASRPGEPGLGVLMVRLVARSPGNIGSRPLTGKERRRLPPSVGLHGRRVETVQPQPPSGPETLGWMVDCPFFCALVLWVGVALVGGSLVASKKTLFIEFRAPQVQALKRRQSCLGLAIAFLRFQFPHLVEFRRIISRGKGVLGGCSCILHVHDRQSFPAVLHSTGRGSK
ncbi:hypothetical protein CABS01_05066 [Colletotrichum abscissum]|uniref:uncharacterized protein n=1 Tax=Colletotrichum abscissum TaxID=1671311 RepID=UPI0027D549E0|nr:uncharacterized protein CABS01_05066 [Colletotrichum abscissum]KAK1523445.1 hypothetical protein CABS01_05066 [Colletotrichum abscissum]